MEYQASTFVNNAALRAQAATAMATNADDPRVTDLLTSLVNEHAADLNETDTAEAAVVLLGAFVSAKAMEFASSTKGAPANIAAKPTSISKRTAAINPTETDIGVMNEVLKSEAAEIANNRENTKLISILTRKPAVKDRLGNITQMTINVSDAIEKKLNEYIPAKGSEEALEQLKNTYAQAKAKPGMTVDIAINENARPVVEAYRFRKNTGAGNDDKVVKKNNAVLKAYVAANFGGKLKENTDEQGNPTMGVFLRAAKGDEAGSTRISAIVTGTSEYWKLNEKGEVTYDVSTTETETVTVRSKMSAKIQDGEKTRTIRLSGQVQVPKIKRNSNYEFLGQISGGVGSGGGVKAADAPDSKTMDAAALLMSQIAVGNNRDVVKDDTVAASLNKMLDKYKTNKQAALSNAAADNR